ncbi:hypothetical protein CDV55_106186 [Aspergillus turcosus]|uniref:Aminoglycoside phosphotransferase domain-containing protein n=1 Tax=Aspergillus turcosus TaxID=1245748 RepID=A0A229X3D7_9EURO|nr:hypothetical protein CDV55_106186 [Aspergillus turcosus]RLM00378.1 hypothetical protein CFD26_106520 [Aspergillus turcosus]
MSPATSLPLLTGSITLSDALDEEDNVLERLSYPEKRLDFCKYLFTHTNTIKAIVSHHLRIPEDSCRVPWVDEWLHGSFNICIPIYINAVKRLMIRFPLPYKIGESTHSGNAEEKLRCEVATYAWMESHCPSVPIPCLWGFGYPSGPSFTVLHRAPLLSRLGWNMRRLVSWILRRPIPSPYVAHPHREDFASGYMLVDYVENGRMLSESWDTLRNDPERRKTLFRDMARIMLSLARVGFPRIGSLTMDNHAIVTLTNRPLTLQLHQLENESIPTNIPRDLTYTTTDTYVLDLLTCHDNRIRHQPNSIIDYSDGESQLSALAIMRALVPHFTNRELRYGPFILMLTDLHPSNIFVDGNGHVTCLIDLEWTCSQPAEMLRPPYWLTGRGIDQITDEHLEAYRARHEEFMAIWEEEERAYGSAVPCADLMRAGWTSGNFWYFSAVNCFKGLYNVFLQHIQPLYGASASKDWKDFERVVAPYWVPGTPEFIREKVREREQYLQQLHQLFQRAESRED